MGACLLALAKSIYYFDFLKEISNNLELLSFQKMYSLWGYLLKQKRWHRSTRGGYLGVDDTLNALILDQVELSNTLSNYNYLQ